MRIEPPAPRPLIGARRFPLGGDVPRSASSSSPLECEPLDPNATFLDLIGGTDPDDIRADAMNLAEWIRRGGFRPRAVNSRGESLPDGWALTVGAIRFARLEDGTVGVSLL